MTDKRRIDEVVEKIARAIAASRYEEKYWETYKPEALAVLKLFQEGL